MNDSTSKLIDQVQGLLARHGILTVQQLKSATGKSQPSISLALGHLGLQVCKLGAARSTRYALTQPILGLQAGQPLSWTAPSGLAFEFGKLSFLQTGQVHVRAKAGRDWLGEPGQLLWFLQALRPQGFLGRQLTRLRPDFPADPDHWSAAQVLYMAINHSHDPPGALHLGETKGRSVNQAPQAMAARIAYYDGLARSVTESLPAASSAGGEQPKFVCEGAADPTGHSTGAPPPARRHLIVKFSPPRGTPFGERWHDLLHLEHLALTVLGDHGIAVANSQVVESPQRTYLESERFDRIGTAGKRHVVSAAAVHDGFVKAPRRHWVATCEALVAQRLLTTEHLNQVASVFLFGQYIGNTDMHFGNLSFYAGNPLDDAPAAPDATQAMNRLNPQSMMNAITQPVFTLAPVYDMLPMLWRPGQYGGELEAPPVRPPYQLAGYDVQAAQARAWANVFWRRASQLASLSQALREASAANLAHLESLP